MGDANDSRALYVACLVTIRATLRGLGWGAASTFRVILPPIRQFCRSVHFAQLVALVTKRRTGGDAGKWDGKRDWLLGPFQAHDVWPARGSAVGRPSGVLEWRHELGRRDEVAR